MLYLDPNGYGVLTGGRYNPPPGLHPDTAGGDGLPPQTHVPIVETALHSVFPCKGYRQFATVCLS